MKSLIMLWTTNFCCTFWLFFSSGSLWMLSFYSILESRGEFDLCKFRRCDFLGASRVSWAKGSWGSLLERFINNYVCIFFY